MSGTTRGDGGETSAPPAARETPVSFPSRDRSVTLAGTLALPACRQPAAAVVLGAGSGPLDRDVTIGRHALFRVLAHSLARRGIASLRFDKRGVGGSTGEFASTRSGQLVADVLGAWDLLLARPGIPSAKVGLVGHSEGGEIVLQAAAVESVTAFCVALATPLLSGVDNFVCAFALLGRGEMRRDAEFERNAAELSELLRLARSGGAAATSPLAHELAARLAPRIANERTRVVFGTPRLSGPALLKVLASSCLDVSLGWDPDRVAAEVACPVLLVYASMDFHVPALENVAAAHALVDHLGRVDWSIRELPGMNHAFQRCETGMPDELDTIDHVMADELADEVADWITRTE